MNYNVVEDTDDYLATLKAGDQVCVVYPSEDQLGRVATIGREIITWPDTSPARRLEPIELGPERWHFRAIEMALFEEGYPTVYLDDMDLEWRDVVMGWNEDHDRRAI